MNETPYTKLQQLLETGYEDNDELAAFALVSIAKDLHDIAYYMGAVTMEVEGFPQAVKIWPLGS